MSAGRDRRADSKRPDTHRTNLTSTVEIRDDGDRMNALVDVDDASLIVAWDSGEVCVDELLDLLDDAEREIRHQVRSSTSSNSPDRQSGDRDTDATTNGSGRE